MRTVIVIENADGAIRRLEAIDQGLTDVAPFLKQAGTVALESAQKNFQEGGRPKWTPISWATAILRAKGKKGYREKSGLLTKRTFERFVLNAKTLRDTGLLMASIGNPSSSQGVYELEKDSITIGTAVKYARPLHDGVDFTKGFITGKKLPARPFMTLQDSDRERIYDLAVEFARKQTGKN